MLDVFRFVWFAVRTFLGVIALVLALYAALWLFVKVDSTLRGNVDPDAALRRVKLYNAQAGTQRREADPASPAATKGCNPAGAFACDRH
jgi:hypothetical protein